MMLILYPPRLSGIFLYAAAALIIVQYAPPNYFDRVATIKDLIPGMGSDINNEDSFRGRSSEGQVGIMIFLDHPMMGVGLRNYSEYYLHYSSDLGIDSRRVARTPHNRYIEVLAEHGLVGITVFIALLVSIFQRVQTARQHFRQANLHEYVYLTTAFAVSVLGYCIVYFFIDDTHPRYFWLMFGIAYALPQVAQYERDRRQQPFDETPDSNPDHRVVHEPYPLPEPIA